MTNHFPSTCSTSQYLCQNNAICLPVLVSSITFRLYAWHGRSSPVNVTYVLRFGCGRFEGLYTTLCFVSFSLTCLPFHTTIGRVSTAPTLTNFIITIGECATHQTQPENSSLTFLSAGTIQTGFPFAGVSDQ